MIHTRETLRVNELGHLEIGGADCVALAEQFGTPLYVLDEKHIRDMMAVYRDTLASEYGEGCIFYASKAFSCEAIYVIAKQEGLGVDVVSGGELYTALKAGFPAEKICMHGNNKLPREMDYALDSGVGLFVLDAYTEADYLDEGAAKRGIVQDVLVRVNPGIEAHTHAYIQTATPDSKFGFSIANGDALKFISHVLAKPNLRLRGFHCHIGSQIFERNTFSLSAERCLLFALELKKKFGFEMDILNLGGGIGIWYSEGDVPYTVQDYAGYLRTIINTVKNECKDFSLKLPKLMFEPGRSIVGEAGITLYTVGTIKEITGLKKYVAIDGGMFDNPRFCLYQAQYTALLANHAAEPPIEYVSLAGKCCESGDLIARKIHLQRAETGDILAVFSTGAYNYSMASNYNRNLVPPVVLVKDGKAEYIVKPQTYEDLVRNDVLPKRLLK